jgi:AcrR family transcriptional regulator
MKRERLQYHHGNLRTALIQTGLKLIAEKGVRALTLREIGARVGVSRMAAYRHFADKDDLLSAIADAGFVQFAEALEQARQTAAGGFAERFSAMGLAYVRFAAEHPAYMEVMFGWGGGPVSRQTPAGQRAFGILVQTIQEGQSTGEVRPGDPVILARLVWAQVHGISMLRLGTDLSENGPGTQFVRLSSEILLAGLAASRHSQS